MTNQLRRALTGSLLLCCLTLAAQEKGYWRAASSNAKSITGDVTLAEEKITIDFISFTMVRVRPLAPAEVSALFDADPSAGGSSSLYRLDVPFSKKFLRKNSLCGGEDTEWMATYAAGHNLQLVFFSGQKPPVFTLDAISNSTDVCGTYAYVK
jgi:hypothetical protein